MSVRRFPLLVGLRAFRLLAVAPTWLLFVAAFSQMVYLVGPDLPHGNTLRLIGYLGLVLALCMIVSPLALIAMIGFIVRTVRGAIAARACDLLVSREGIRVSGGPANGFSASWANLAHRDAVQWSQQGLSLRAADGKVLHVPRPDDPDERASLEAVVATIGAHSAAFAAGNRAPARKPPPGTILCTGCGAPQRPVDSPEVSCPHCATKTPIPSELVAKIRALREVANERRLEDQLASALLTQRGAGFANAVAFVGGLLTLGLSGMTLLLTAMFAFVDGKETGLPRAGFLGLFEVGLCLVVFALVRWSLSNRRALRLLTAGFSAEEPANEGDPPACRSCAAPLPEAEAGAGVVRCVYCSSPNVMAADLRFEASIVERFGALAKDPHDVLATCARQRRGAVILGGIGALLILGSGVWYIRDAQADEGLSANTTVEIPFEEQVESILMGRIEAGPGAARVVHVADLGNVSGALVVSTPGAQPVLHGKQFPLKTFPWAWHHDRIIVDVSPGPGHDFLVTTRASKEGHFRVRVLGESGEKRQLLDDARHASLAPDGKGLAFGRLLNDRFQLAISNLDTPTKGRILTRGGGHLAYPVWSPDGQRIAFLTETVRDPIQYSKRYGQTNLWMIDLEGHADRLTVGASLTLEKPLWTAEGIWVLGRESRPEGVTTVLWRVEPK